MNALRFLLVLALVIVGISPVASGRVRLPPDALAVGDRPEIAVEVVNRVPYLSAPDLKRCVALHMGAVRPLPGASGVQQVTMRWTFEPLPDAGGTVKYIGPGSATYPAPLMLRHPILIRVDINVGTTATMRRTVITLASCDPRRPRLGRAISRLSRSVFSGTIPDRDPAQQDRG